MYARDEEVAEFKRIILNICLFDLIQNWKFYLKKIQNPFWKRAYLFTVSPTHSRSIPHLWYDLGVIWLSILYFKSAAKPIFFLKSNKHRSDLSKNLVFDPVGPRATKLWALKVCPGRGSNPGGSESCDSLNKLAKIVASNPKGLEFFLTANFDGP